MLLITVAAANLLWVAGVPTTSSPARLSPQTDPFPLIRPSTSLHVLPVPPTTNESTRLTLLSIQGLANRGGAQLYLDFDNETGNASSLLSFLVSHYGVSYDSVSLDWVYARYLPTVAGLVVIDPARPESVNVATMIASLEDAVIAGPDTAGLLRREYGLSVLLDYGASNWSTFDSTTVYDRALDALYPRLDPNLLAILPPDRLALRDYLIATRTFVFYEPQGVLALPSQLAATQRVLAATPHGIPILGWFDSPTLTEENAFVQIASQYGKAIVGSQTVPNLSVLTAFGRNRARAQPTPPATPALENKTYVVVAVPDGDNLDFIANRMRQLWAEPERGSFPLAWSLSPVLADLAPPYLDYYYGSASPNDRFVLGPSGAGYLYPNYVGPGDLAPFLQVTARYANETGMDVAWLLNAFVASEIPYGSSTLSAYVDALQPRGLVLDYDDQPKTQTVWMQAGATTAAPVIRSTQLWTTMDNLFAKLGDAMATWDGGPHFFWITVYTFRFDLHDMAAMLRELGSRTRGNLQVVAPEQLFGLMQEDFAIRARGQVEAARADPFASTFLASQIRDAEARLDQSLGPGGPGMAAYQATVASADLEALRFYEGAFALALVVVAAALVTLALRRRRSVADRRSSLVRGRALLVLGVASALFVLATRAALAANFWSYQWIVVGVVLAGVGRPLARFLDRRSPELALLGTAGLDLACVGMALATNVAFALAAIGTVALVDGILRRETVPPAGMVLALCLGTAAGFVAGVDLLTFAILGGALLLALLWGPFSMATVSSAPAKGAYLRGFSVALPVVVLMVASNYALGLRLQMQGANLPILAAFLLAAAPFVGLLLSGSLREPKPRSVQVVGYAVAALSLLAVGFAVGTLAGILLLASAVAGLAAAAAATLRGTALAGRDPSAVVASALAWVPLLLIFFRMPPVIYSLAVVRIPEAIEVVLYAPEFLFAAVAGVIAAECARRALRERRVGKGYPPGSSLGNGRSP